jgi:hypothetical protein
MDWNLAVQNFLLNLWRQSGGKTKTSVLAGEFTADWITNTNQYVLQFESPKGGEKDTQGAENINYTPLLLEMNQMSSN